MKNAWIISIVLLSGTVWAGTYSGGAGTAVNPYQISTVADWLELIESQGDWDKHFVLMNDIDFKGATIAPIAPDLDPLARNLLPCIEL